ncbi:hypothetical protein Mycsm_07087 (plasmid) [Mycobacterium sp. JS623]|uniref:hypothetical protein n=1 Tax=Mycobacterium sp. JS623 TaxID=212767 RepID=UPI0002A57FD6|nr:hypothetical protein [Mycobacterium sp. JS623]AGB27184.1 hypothetical protein Mycsm_07087 [Mycobacterium sp. JS623]
MAHIDDETLVDVRRELRNFQSASGNREYEASLLAGAVQELLDQAQSTNPAERPILRYSIGA